MPQLSYGLYLDAAVEGLLGDGFLGQDLVSRQVVAGRAQVDTIVVSGATNLTDYTVTINGVPVLFTSDATATATELRDGLVAAINADAYASQIVTAAPSGADVTLTGVLAGVAFTATEDDSGTGNLSISTTTTPLAGTLNFGRAVVRSGFGGIALPTGATEVFEGITAFVQKSQPNAPIDSTLDATGTPVYNAGEEATVARKARVWVRPETAIAVTDGVFVRHAVAGDTALGKFTNVDDGNTVAMPTGRWLSGATTADQLCLVEINIP